MDSTKGLQYEKYIKSHIITNLNTPAYLWHEIPEKLLIQANLIHSNNTARLKRRRAKSDNINPLVDTGIDILQQNENSFTIVQCKSGYESGITIANLAGFSYMTTNHRHLFGDVYYTSKLSAHIEENHAESSIRFIRLPIDPPLAHSPVPTPFIPFDYQNDAKNTILEHFIKDNKAILSLPCGCGKTFTSYLISEAFESIILLSPLKQFAKQNMDRFIEYGYDKKNTLLIDSDGTRDSIFITNFIKNRKSILISATYDSVDKVFEIITLLSNTLIIIDEFHNLSKRNVTDSDDTMYKLLNSSYKIMFMSATPRVYEIENDIDDGIDLGDIIYQMSFTTAISNKYITDYRIFLPSIHETNGDLIEDINKEINLNTIGDSLRAKCLFLFKGLLHHGNRKCIIYCKDTNELATMIKNMNTLNEYFIMDLNIQSITSKTGYSARQKILRDFEDDSRVQLLFSVRILDECIDIPRCDSIYITYECKSKIRTIQRMCRCIRIDKDNKFKIGHVYIWCDEYAEILDTLSGIKEYDVMFSDKISVMSIDWTKKEGVDKDKVDEDIKFVEDFVMEVKEYKCMSWDKKLEAVKKYMDDNNKRPSAMSDDEGVRRIGAWICTQNKNYKKRIRTMKTIEYRNKWDEFKKSAYGKYILTTEDKWDIRFKELVQYIETNKNIPSRNDENIASLRMWLDEQRLKYTRKTGRMKYIEYQIKWKDFIETYGKYIISNEDKWKNWYAQLETFIKDNNRLPSESIKTEKKLGKWLNHQNENYINKNKSMNTVERQTIWEKLVKNNKHLFYTDEEKWDITLNNIIDFIKQYNKLPVRNHKNIFGKSLGKWISRQTDNYNKNIYLMQDNSRRAKWEQFRETYKILFFTNEQLWDYNMQLLITFITQNKRLPSKKDKNIEYLRKWVSHQNTNYTKQQYIMKNPIYRAKWEHFKQNYSNDKINTL